MARYMYGSQRNLGGKWISIVSIVVIGALAIILVLWYNPFTQKKPIETSQNVEETVEPEVKPQPKPKIEPQPEPPSKPQEQEIVQKKPDIPKPPQPVVEQVKPVIASKEIISELGPDSEAAKLIKEAMKSLETQPPKIVEARDKLNDVLLMPLSPDQKKFVKDKLSQLSDKWLFSKTIYPGDKLCGSYRVKTGDYLAYIGSDYNVPHMILQRINDIPRPELLRAGENIKIINGPFNVRIYRSAFTMDLFLKNTYVKSFPVGLGKPGHETPTGLWVVKRDGKLIKPPWTDPDTGRRYESDDPNYPLGSRWIALEGIEGNAKGREGFAIHGTKDPAEIGTAKSRGCIRLFNGDAILVYDLLMPGVSKVDIRD